MQRVKLFRKPFLPDSESETSKRRLFFMKGTSNLDGFTKYSNLTEIFILFLPVLGSPGYGLATRPCVDRAPSRSFQAGRSIFNLSKYDRAFQIFWTQIRRNRLATSLTGLVPALGSELVSGSKQTEPNMDVCRVNRAVYGNFDVVTIM